MATVPNPASSIFTFILITIFYFVIKYKTPDSLSKIITIVYIVAIISTQITINASLAKAMCDNNKANSTALLATIFPIVFIFGILYLFLLIFPGWLEPFSNTFGYAMTKLNGIRDFLGKLLNRPLPTMDKSITKAINNIYSDPSIFINQFNYDDKEAFDTIWNRNLQGNIFIKEATIGSNYYNDFINYVKLKDIVGTFVWFLLVGILVTTRSYNYIIAQPCSLSPDKSDKSLQNYTDTKDNNKPELNVTPPGYSYKR